MRLLGTAFVSIALAYTAFAQDANLVVTSTLDGTEQPNYFVGAVGDEARPLLVALHTWSNGFDTDTGDGMRAWERAAKSRNWHYLQPHFRGPNKTPAACASPLARQDILDAVDAAVKRAKVDTSRIYLAGTSGGGHMSMVMAAYAPERWAAVSAWAGISDLVAWYAECQASGRRYWENLEASCGGAPGASDAIDKEYAYRSPIHHLAAAKDLPLDLNEGINDGYEGSVPIHHTLDAFNVIARARGDEEIPAQTIVDLGNRVNLPSFVPRDPAYDRGIIFRKSSGPSRVSIFEGGHEGLPEAACDWLKQHKKGE